MAIARAALAVDRLPPSEQQEPVLPLGWRSAIDPRHNRRYFYLADGSGHVQWEVPTTAAPAAAEAAAARGDQRRATPQVAGDSATLSLPRTADTATLSRPRKSGVSEVFTEADLTDADLAAQKIQEAFQAQHHSRAQRLKTAGAQRARGVRDAVRTRLRASNEEPWATTPQAQGSDGSTGTSPTTSPPRERPPYPAGSSSESLGSAARIRAGAVGMRRSPSPPPEVEVTLPALPPPALPPPSWRHDPRTGGLVRVNVCSSSQEAGLALAAAAASGSPTSPMTGPASPRQRPTSPLAGEQSAQELQQQVDSLTAQLAEAQWALSEERRQTEQWRRCVREIGNGMLLNARMNAKYVRRVASRLEATLLKLNHIENVKYVNCSFPSVAADAPFLQLLSYNALDSSRWEVAWSPCWSVELCLEGHSFLVPFSVVVRLRSLRLRGEMTMSFPPDMAHAIISFVDTPEVQFEVDSDVSVGAVPMPLKSAVSHKIRAELHKWMASRVVAPQAMRINRKHDGTPKDQPTLQRTTVDGVINPDDAFVPPPEPAAPAAATGEPAASAPAAEAQSPKADVTDEQLQQAILAALDSASRSAHNNKPASKPAGKSPAQAQARRK